MTKFIDIDATRVLSGVNPAAIQSYQVAGVPLAEADHNTRPRQVTLAMNNGTMFNAVSESGFDVIRLLQENGVIDDERADVLGAHYGTLACIDDIPKPEQLSADQELRQIYGTVVAAYKSLDALDERMKREMAEHGMSGDGACSVAPEVADVAEEIAEEIAAEKEPTADLQEA